MACRALTRVSAAFALVSVAVAFAHAQTNDANVASSLMKAPDAFARLSADQERETEAYTLGVQAR